MGNGHYACAGLNLDNSHKYRLNIKTAGNKQYVSDYMAVLNSPPIDSVSYDIKGTVFEPGLNIYANTHDPTGKAHYYRWDYQETWMIHAYFTSYFKSDGYTVSGRDMVNDNITHCWRSDSSSVIVLASTAKLVQDVVVNLPVTFISSASEKASEKYSIKVKQYALTTDAYNFYANIKKNTEQLGSIFDALPTEINGNVHCVTNPSEPVIGYVSVGGTSSRRIFITFGQLQGWVISPTPSDCVLAFPNDRCCLFQSNSGGPKNQVDWYINYKKRQGNFNPLIPLDAIGVPGSPPVGYTAASRECADCTLRGSNKKPAFWK